MKKIGILIAIVAILAIWAISAYNGLIGIDEDVKKAWSEVQTQYQRRADVFISQMEVVKGAAKNEQEIFIGVAKARAGIVEAKEGMSKAETPAQLDQYLNQAKQAALALNVQVERYPEVKSTEAFIKFQDEVSGTENRISTSRSDYNTVVTTYNKKVRSFPAMLYAGALGFDQKQQFESEEGTDKRPDIKF